MSKIVICDDDQDILETTAELLRAQGHDVTTVHRAHEILETVRRQRPDLLLQDLGMPGLDVAALIRDVRTDAALAPLPILLFTGSVTAEELAEDLQVQGVVEKPFSNETLQRRIRAILGPNTRR